MTRRQVAAHQHYSQLIDRLAQVRSWLESSLEGVAEAEIEALAKRFPKRRIEFHSGMGSTSIEVSSRTGSDAYSYGGELEWTNWPEWLAIPAPALWEAINRYQDEVSEGKDPGIGTIIYDNGRRIEGTPAGGEVR